MNGVENDNYGQPLTKANPARPGIGRLNEFSARPIPPPTHPLPASRG